MYRKEHQDKPKEEHIYDDISTVITRKPTEKDTQYTVATEKRCELLYDTPRTAVIHTSSNEAYRCIVTEQT